jgi:hypothetical protein
MFLYTALNSSGDGIVDDSVRREYAAVRIPVAIVDSIAISS